MDSLNSALDEMRKYRAQLSNSTYYGEYSKVCPPLWHIVLCMGEENAVGTTGPIDSNLDTSDGRIFQYCWSKSSPFAGRVMLAGHPLEDGPNTNTIGPAIDFCKRYLLDKELNVRILLVQTAMQDTSLCSTPCHWAPYPSTSSWPAAGERYRTALQQLKAASAALGASYSTRMAAILWLGGQTDATRDASMSNHKLMLASLIQKLRNAPDMPIDMSTCPFVIGHTPIEFAAGGVRDAMSNVVACMPYTGQTSNIIGHSFKPNFTAYDPEGTRIMSTRLFDAYLACNSNASPPLPKPSFAFGPSIHEVVSSNVEQTRASFVCKYTPGTVGTLSPIFYSVGYNGIQAISTTSNIVVPDLSSNTAYSIRIDVYDQIDVRTLYKDIITLP
jgi:Carbohydrate esterase, sialic acid-specific acetylesterase